MSLSQQVLVNYEYKYTTRDGREVSIKPNERYILVAKTNETWWHVRRDESDKPFFIPATYVTELSPETSQTPLDPLKEFSGSECLKSASEAAPDSLPTIIEPTEVTLRVPASIIQDTEKDGHRISTYIIPKEFFELKGLDPDPIKTEAEADPVPELQIYDTIKDKPSHPATNGETPPSVILLPVLTVNTPLSPKMEIKLPVNTPERPLVDSKTLDQDIQMLNRAGWGDVWSAMNKEEIVYENLDTTRDAESSKAGDNMTVKPVTPDRNMKQGLVIIPEDTPNGDVNHESPTSGITVVTQEAAQVLESAGDGPLDVRLQRLADEKDELLSQINRLEGQVSRYKAAADNAEKIEDELKAENRKLQRELRTALDKIEEMEMTNNHLIKRLEKMKANRNALLSQQ